MRSIWMQIILLVVYVLLVFFLSRIIDLVLWYQHGMSSTQIVDPLLLSVRQLKLLLESRGVGYTGYVEKKDLAHLAEAAAHIVQGEVEELSQRASGGGADSVGRERLPVPPASSQFTGGAHFYEEVEDTKDSVWLVQVVPAGNKNTEPLLDDYNWRVVCNNVAPFAIRTGIFDCKLDRRLCSSKGWHYPLLLLALPKGTRAKDKVILKTFTAARPQPILEWVRDQLSIRVNTLNSADDLQDWIGSNRTHDNSTVTSGSEKDVKVLLLTHLLHPPLFLAALSIKFTGRIKFGMLSVKKQDADTMKKLKNMDVKVPSCIIVTPERKTIYGKRKYEHFNFDSMNRYLRAIQPEMNDVFLCSLIIVNLLVGLQIFQGSVGLWWKHVARCVWALVSYNFWLFVIWLLILAMYRFSAVSIAGDRCLVLVRLLSLSEIGAQVRTDWQQLLRHPYPLALSFLLYGLLCTRLLRLNAADEPETATEPDRPWWEVLPVDSFWINCFFRPMATLSRPLPPSEVELEEGIEMLIERLAVPNLWLQPVIPNEYIKDLPVWKFKGWDVFDSQCESKKNSRKINCDSPETIQWLMDVDDPPKEYHKSDTDSCSTCVKAKLKHRQFPSHSCCHNLNPASKCDIASSKHKQECTGEQCVVCNRLFSRAKTDPSAPTSCGANSGGAAAPSPEARDVSEESGEEAEAGLPPPPGMLPTMECAVCLEAYARGALLCGLPCGHSYHQSCIMLWLQRDNHHCPVCRWPAYKAKSASATATATTTHPHHE